MIQTIIPSKKTLLISAITIVAIVVVVLIVIFVIIPSTKNKSPFINPLNIPNQISNTPFCSNCDYLKKYYSGVGVCQSSPEQELASSDCKNEFCMDGMEDIYVGCYAPGKGECNSCEFGNVIGSCVEDAIRAIPNMDISNPEHRFLLKLYISNYCSSCIPSDKDIDLLAQMVNNNRILNYCGRLTVNENTNRLFCPEMLTYIQECVQDTKQSCDDCDFLTSLTSQCTQIQPGFQDNKELSIAMKCGCIPTQEQLSIIESQVDIRNCLENGCPETEELMNKCIGSPTTTPQPTQELSLPPIDNYCSDCQFRSNLNNDCLLFVLLDPTSPQERDYNIYLSCGCGPTDEQSQALTQLIDNNVDFQECLDNPNCQYLNNVSHC